MILALERGCILGLPILVGFRKQDEMEETVVKIISGGQSGADIGGLMFAKYRGIKTGGWMPKGWLTEDGNKPEYAHKYNMVEHSGSYRDRTFANVRDSDATIRFATNWQSTGELCTRKAIKYHGKKYFDVTVSNPPPPEKLAQWLKDNDVKILNVAGNRESTSPGICDFVVDYLGKVFDKYDKHSTSEENVL